MLVIETTPDSEKLFSIDSEFNTKGKVYKLFGLYDHHTDDNVKFLRKEFNAKFDPVSVFIHKGFCYPVKVKDDWQIMSVAKYKFITWLLTPEIFPSFEKAILKYI